MKKRTPQITVVLLALVAEAVEEKAALLGVTKSEYAAMIIGQWFAKECPPVNELDEAARRSLRQKPRKVLG